MIRVLLLTLAVASFAPAAAKKTNCVSFKFMCKVAGEPSYDSGIHKKIFDRETKLELVNTKPSFDSYRDLTHQVFFYEAFSMDLSREVNPGTPVISHFEIWDRVPKYPTFTSPSSFAKKVKSAFAPGVRTDRCVRYVYCNIGNAVAGYITDTVDTTDILGVWVGEKIPVSKGRPYLARDSSATGLCYADYVNCLGLPPGASDVMRVVRAGLGDGFTLENVHKRDLRIRVGDPDASRSPYLHVFNNRVVGAGFETSVPGLPGPFTRREAYEKLGEPDVAYKRYPNPQSSTCYITLIYDRGHAYEAYQFPKDPDIRTTSHCITWDKKHFDTFREHLGYRFPFDVAQDHKRMNLDPQAIRYDAVTACLGTRWTEKRHRLLEAMDVFVPYYETHPSDMEPHVRKGWERRQAALAEKGLAGAQPQQNGMLLRFDHFEIILRDTVVKKIVLLKPINGWTPPSMDTLLQERGAPLYRYDGEYAIWLLYADDGHGWCYIFDTNKAHSFKQALLVTPDELVTLRKKAVSLAAEPPDAKAAYAARMKAWDDSVARVGKEVEAMRRERKQRVSAPPEKRTVNGPCINCNGWGSTRCGVCNATGYTYDPRYGFKKPCYKCGGSGREHCTRCSGTGKQEYSF